MKHCENCTRMASRIEGGHYEVEIQYCKECGMQRCNSVVKCPCPGTNKKYNDICYACRYHYMQKSISSYFYGYERTLWCGLKNEPCWAANTTCNIYKNKAE